MCRVVPLRVGFLRVGFLRVGFRVGFFSRLGVAAAPVAGVLSVFFRASPRSPCRSIFIFIFVFLFLFVFRYLISLWLGVKTREAKWQLRTRKSPVARETQKISNCSFQPTPTTMKIRRQRAVKIGSCSRFSLRFLGGLN